MKKKISLGILGGILLFEVIYFAAVEFVQYIKFAVQEYKQQK